MPHASYPIRMAAIMVIAGAITLTGGAPRAADPQPYTVSLGKTGNGALDAALDGSSELVSLRESAPVGPFALVARARNDQARFTTALNSFGYFGGRAVIRIDSHPIDDPSLVDLLQDLPAKPPAKVEVTFDPGPQFHLRNITVLGSVPPDAAAALDLKPGGPAMASDVLAAQQRLLTTLRNEGYALAKVDLVPAMVHLPEHVMDVTFRCRPGHAWISGRSPFRGCATSIHHSSAAESRCIAESSSAR